MPRLFIAAFLAPSPEQRQPPKSSSAVATAFHAAAQRGTFPYDIGDDPSFFSAGFLGGRVTWGVCRQDVRRLIGPGDWMAFFSASRNERTGLTRYRFVAALLVEEKIRQTEIFEQERFSLYREYLNLLVRPAGSGWEHFEPEMAWTHDDWLWRICDTRGLRKAAVAAAGEAHTVGAALPVPVGKNYVVFSTASSVIAADPPEVAIHERGEATERWRPDPRSAAIRGIVFGSSSRGLRTRNRQQPHRHIQREVDEGWHSSLRRCLDQYGVILLR